LERYLGAVANDSLAFIDLALASAFPLFAIGIEHPLDVVVQRLHDADPG